MALPTGSRSRHRILRNCVAVSLCAGVLGGARTAGSQAEDTPPLTTIAAIRALTPEQANQQRRVVIRGTVTYINERDPAGIIVHDGKAGQFVHYGLRYFRTHARVALHPGDLVEIDGRTAGGGFAPDVVPDGVTLLGRSALPAPKRVPYVALLSGGFDCDYVEVTGVGQRAWISESGKIMFLDVAVEGGTVRAWFWDFTPADLTRFVDARVRLLGSAGILYNTARQVRAISLFAARTADAVVETPAPDPWSLQVRAISSLFTHQAKDQLDRRVRLRGIVTGTRVGQPVLVEDITMRMRMRDVRHSIYVRDDTSAALVQTEQPFELSPGDLVDVAGFPLVSSTKPRLQNAVIRRVTPGTAPSPVALSKDTLMAADHDSELVSIDATLLTEVSTPAGRSLVLKVGDTVFEASHDPISSVPTSGVTSGSLVSVTGIYAFEPGPPPSFRLFLRSSGDVRLLAGAPWWTPRHSLVLFLVMAVTGVFGLLWARLIANRNALVREQYRAIIQERSRLASELHDTLEQGLAGIQLQLGAVARTLDSSPQTARRALGIASEMLRYSLSEARRSVMDLRPEALERRGFVGALSELAHQMTTGTAVDVKVRTVGPVRSLEGPQEHHLFRIGLEALTNSIKHASASRVDVELRFDEEAVQLVVSDDGEGFADIGFDHVGHFGLRGIRERVDKIGGTLRLENQSGGGAVVAVRVPRVQTAAPREAVHG